MVKADRALELGEVEVLPGHVAHGATDDVQGVSALPVGILPSPAVVGQRCRVGDGSQRAVGLHPHPDSIGGILMGSQQPQALLLPHRLTQLHRGVSRANEHRHQGHSRAAGGLPGPGVGPAGAGVLPQGAVGVLLGTHQGDGALVHLGLGIHHLKNPLGARQGGQEGGHLLGDLVEGLAHLLGVVEVDHQAAQVKALEDGQQSAEGGGEGVADVHQVTGDGHDHGGVVVGLLGSVPVGLVELFKLLLGLLLVGKGLDYLQALNHLLDVAVHITQGSLLLLIELTAAAAQALEELDGHNKQQGGDDKQLPVDKEHQAHQAHKHQAAGTQGDHALLQGQLYVVRVVGKAAHQLAVGVLVKVAQGQVLELVEQVLAQAVDAPLGQTDHYGSLAVGGQTADKVDAHQHDDGLGQTGHVGTARPDKVVDDATHHIGAAQVGAYRHQQAAQHRQQRQLAAGEVAQQTADGLAHILGLLESPSGGMIGSRHYSPTPSC